MIHNLIHELVEYGMRSGLIDAADKIYVTNRLLELFRLSDYTEPESVKNEPRQLHLILEELTDYAWENGILDENTITDKDLFDTKVMGLLTHRHYH